MIQPGYYLQFPRDYYVCAQKNTPAPSPVFRRFLCLNCVLAVMLLSLAAANAWARDQSPSTQPLSVDQRVERLINDLGSDDANVRQSASTSLVAMGLRARPEILKASKSDDPGLRQQADQILLSLPWQTADDSFAVINLLQRYGVVDIDVRRDVVRQLAQLDDERGVGALARLIDEDPSPGVQWTIVSCLRERDYLSRFRAVTSPADNSRLLAICGYAKLGALQPAALADLRRCAMLELANPTDDNGEFDFVIRILANEACKEGLFEQAVEWRRKEWTRGSQPDETGTPTALLELFALQADFGPIKGYEDDIRLAGNDIQNPKIQYALAEMYGRMHDPKRADAAKQAAFSASNTRMQRYDVSEFLVDHGWDDLAEGELNAYLKIPQTPNMMESPVNDANVHFRLAGLALSRGDDQAVAEHKEQAMHLLGSSATLDMVDPQGHLTPTPSSTIWAQIYFHYMRAAISQHNEHETQRRLEQLMELKPTDPDIAIEVVPFLRKMGRTIDADLMFQWAFDAMKKELDQHPQSPEALNGIAWLCAECDRNLDDARAWAEKAVALTPDNAAILDTLADVNFRLGRFQEAL